MYTIRFTGEFKRQMKMCERRGYDMELLREAIRIHQELVLVMLNTGTHSDLFSKKYKK